MPPFIHFWSPDDLAGAASWNPDAEPQRYATGVGHNLLELFVRLRTDGAHVHLGERAPRRPDLVVVAAGSVRKSARNLESSLHAIARARGRFVLIRSDTPLSWRFPLEPTVELMPYASVVERPTQRWLPPLPQRGIVRRADTPTDRLRRITIKCNPVTLPEELRDGAIAAALDEVGVDLWIDMPTETDGSDHRWHDFAEVDAVLCARAQSAGREWIDSKPATKLINAWVAGCIPLAAREPAYVELAADGSDVRFLDSVADLPAAVESLNRDPGALRRLQRGVRSRQAEFDPAGVLALWRELLEETASVTRTSWPAAVRAGTVAEGVRAQRLRDHVVLAVRLRLQRLRPRAERDA